MIKKVFQYSSSYLITLVLLYSVYDYFEHIGRSGSSFEAHPWYWLLFTSSAIGSLILVFLAAKQVLEKLFKAKSLFIEVAAIGLWLGLYLSILGPLIDHFFWPFDDLYFSFKFGPFFIILNAYFGLRLVLNLLMRKGALYSN